MRRPHLVRCALLFSIAALIHSTAADAHAQRGCALEADKNRDSTNVAVLLMLHAFDREKDPPVHYRQLVAEGIRQFLKIDPPLALDVYDNRAFDTRNRADSSHAFLSVTAAYRATLLPDGRLVNPRITGGSHSVTLDRAVLRAIAALDSSQLIPPPPPGIFEQADSLDVSLTISSVAHPDRIEPTGISEVWSGQITLFIFKSPLRTVTRMSRPLSRQDVHYPLMLRARGVQGKVLLSMVISPDGQIEANSIQALEADHVDFLQAVLDAAPAMLFEPLKVAGCAVRQSVEMPFSFTLH